MAGVKPLSSGTRVRISLPRAGWRTRYYIVDVAKRRVARELAPKLPRSIELDGRRYAVVEGFLASPSRMYISIVYAPRNADRKEICRLVAKYIGVWPPGEYGPAPVFNC